MTSLRTTRPAAVTAKPPLAVDLDGTLMRGDLFAEAMLRFVFVSPWKAPLLLLWLMRGRAYAKAKLAEHAPFDPTDLPYDQRVLDWLKAERAEGRTIVLATASDRRAAETVSDHLGLFDAVFASDGRVNLKAQRKAEQLAAAYPDGFAYAGNEAADLKVWAASAQAVLVNTPAGVAARVSRAIPVEKTFAPETNLVRGLIKAIRPQQWAKNILVFLPMLAGLGWLSVTAWAGAGIAFLALCCAASSVYLVNDAADIDADRSHPRKRKRPFASGAVSPLLGLALSVVLLLTGLTLGALANVLPFIALYLASSTLYTFWLKRVVLIDVFLLAGLYTIRIILGGAASGYPASDWLLAFSCFFFLSLALVKRVAEVQALQAKGGGQVSRRGYLGTDGAMLKMMGVGAGFVAALVLALYLQSETVRINFQEPFLLWSLPASIVFWLCRVWLIADRGEMTDDPLVFAFRDRTSWLVGLVAGVGFAAAVLLPAAWLHR